jgi:CDP-glucose 4,6-dehydratase
VDDWLAHWPGKLRVETAAQPAYDEAHYLGLDPSRAMNELGWRPAWNFATAVRQTAQWYWQRHGAGDDAAAMLTLSRAQIQEYSEAAQACGAAWATA